MDELAKTQQERVQSDHNEELRKSHIKTMIFISANTVDLLFILF